MEFDQNKGSFESDEQILNNTNRDWNPDEKINSEDPMANMAEAPDGDTVSVGQASEQIVENHDNNLKMAASIMIQNDPITHEYADVEPVK